jgi:recombinational DNA repair ATPase RecF
MKAGDLTGKQGKPMLKNLTVTNYRCFTGLVFNRLARINLIAGMNNTGKTALLEALQLHMTSRRLVPIVP